MWQNYSMAEEKKTTLPGRGRGRGRVCACVHLHGNIFCHAYYYYIIYLKNNNNRWQKIWQKPWQNDFLFSAMPTYI